MCPPSYLFHVKFWLACGITHLICISVEYCAIIRSITGLIIANAQNSIKLAVGLGHERIIRSDETLAHIIDFDGICILCINQTVRSHTKPSALGLNSFLIFRSTFHILRFLSYRSLFHFIPRLHLRWVLLRIYD